MNCNNACFVCNVRLPPLCHFLVVCESHRYYYPRNDSQAARCNNEWERFMIELVWVGAWMDGWMDGWINGLS